MDKKISIIIPCKNIDFMTKKCIGECLKLNYENFEIIVLPDEKEKVKNKKVRVIETGNVMPAVKRNIGMEKSDADFFAFIDSDAYPKKNWLKNAIRYFNNDKIGIVGGPNLTPKEGNFWEEISGLVLSNFLASGRANIRYKIARNQYSHELPSCNYIARKEAASEYDMCFLTAEDSEFCFNCKKKGYKILYAGDVIVYHHRRDSLKGHIKQMFIYARDIAWMLKKSFSLWQTYYSLMSIFVVGFFIGAILSVFIPMVRIIFNLVLFLYFILILVTSVHKNLRTTLLVFIETVLTHFAYGFGFLHGLLKKKPQQSL